MNYNLFGTVSNSTDGLHIFLNASEEIANDFFHQVKKNPPANASIRGSSLMRCEPKTFSKFDIIESHKHLSTNMVITPDLALCPSCREEMKNPANKRYRYAFITCTECGPRFSIQQYLPYDRECTTMASFHQCPDCLGEYHSPENNRYFSQTNSCNTCGIQLSAQPTDTLSEDSKEAVLKQAVYHLKHGNIVAVKGIGGFLLLCDATNQTAVERLRRRKKRPSKPLALLYPDIKSLKQDFECTTEAITLMQSPQAPIVLLKPQTKQKFNLASKTLAPGLEKLGVMLPYAPLLEIVAEDCGRPLVATSANVSGSPILYQNQDAEQQLSGIADFILYHNRNINIPQDDSVWCSTPFSHSLFPIRRSRGYAPSFPLFQTRSGKCILALGAMMKSSFSLSIRSNTYVSQFLGSTETYESQETFRQTLQKFLNLMQANPELIVTDNHPGYFSHELAIELATRWKLPLLTVQHHEAHALSALAENNLLFIKEPVLCCIWDGTGWGTDHTIWGGEFFIYANQQFERLMHFPLFPVLSGDKMAREPRLSALSLLHMLGLDTCLLKNNFSATEWNVFAKQLENGNLIKTDAAGRIFDAFASLIGLMQVQSFEGEAAMLLENAALLYFREHPGLEFNTIEINLLNKEAMQQFFNNVVQWLKEGKSIGYLAAQFHLALAASIGMLAKNTGVQHLVCSGGVFMNGLLIDLVKIKLGGNPSLYFNVQLPSNDENISFGQLVAGDIHLLSKLTTIIPSTEAIHFSSNK